MAQAQLVGWLEGLFRGIQTALAVQEIANQTLAAQQQLRHIAPARPAAGTGTAEDGDPAPIHSTMGPAAGGRGGQCSGFGYL